MKLWGCAVIQFRAYNTHYTFGGKFANFNELYIHFISPNKTYTGKT